MDCDKLRLEQLASGELSPPTSLLLHWHTMRCPSCRAEYRRARGILTQLRQLAEAPVSDTLRQRALGAFPESEALPGLSGDARKARPKMRRLTYIALCAALLVAVTGALAAKFLLRSSFGCSDRLGRNWHVTGDFHGEVDILDAQGRLAGVFTNGPGEMKEPVEISSSGEIVTVQGQGRHEIQGKDGSRFGYAVLRPLTEKDYLANLGLKRMPTLHEELDRQARDWADLNWDAHGGASGIESAPWGVRGFDTASHLRWRMLGTGDVQVLEGIGKKVLASGHTVHAKAELPRALNQYTGTKEPDLVVTYGRLTWKESGYGTHNLKDDVGNVVLIIEVLPATP